jgi:hypothetical protein
MNYLRLLILIETSKTTLAELPAQKAVSATTYPSDLPNPVNYSRQEQEFVKQAL